MSRFDDELRGATGPLAREPLPEGVLDESFGGPVAMRRLSVLAFASTVGIVAAAMWAGRLSVPVASDGSPSPGQHMAGSCPDLPAVEAFSTEYRVYFPCQDGSGLGSGPRVMALASVEETLRTALGDLLDGPTDEEAASGMAPVASGASRDLVSSVELQPDGLAVIDLDPRLRDIDLRPLFLDALEATGLQFESVTALQLEVGGSCSEFFAIFGMPCNHLAEAAEVAGDCPIVPPDGLPSGSGITIARPYPGRPDTVSWGSGDDTVTQQVGERGGAAAFTDGHDVTVRGYPGKARSASPEFAWVEDGCPYHVIVPGQGDYVAVDYATVFGPMVAQASPTPIPSAPFGSATVEEDGVIVTLVIDRAATFFGQRVWAEVTVENSGSDAVVWGHSSTCTWPAGVWLAAGPAQLPYGRTDWPGDHGVLKNVSVLRTDAIGFGFVPEEVVDFEGNWGCTGDLVMDELAPGASLSHRFAWDTVGVGGMPAPGGIYIAESTFMYFGRGDVSPDVLHDEFEVTARVALDVEGLAVDFLSPGEAMDLLLEDPAFTRQLAAVPRERWTGSDFRWEDETWVLELRLRNPDEALVATVDAVSGEVSGIAIEARASAD